MSRVLWTTSGGSGNYKTVPEDIYDVRVESIEEIEMHSKFTQQMESRLKWHFIIESDDEYDGVVVDGISVREAGDPGSYPH